jgi:DNA-binding MarR family transcriptional regulator
MSDGHQLAMALRAAYLAMHRQADAALEPAGATANQFVILSVLADEDGVTQRELVERTSSDPNTIRPVLAALEARQLVVREPHPDDGRAWCVKLTPAGRRALVEMRATGEGFRQRLTGPFNKQEARTLVELLNRVALAMKRSPRERATRHTKETGAQAPA